MPRIGKIFDFLEKEHLDCVVIKDVNTIRYLTGFRGDSSILYADDRRAVLVTDGIVSENGNRTGGDMVPLFP